MQVKSLPNWVSSQSFQMQQQRQQQQQQKVGCISTISDKHIIALGKNIKRICVSNP